MTRKERKRSRRSRNQDEDGCIEEINNNNNNKPKRKCTGSTDVTDVFLCIIPPNNAFLRMITAPFKLLKENFWQYKVAFFHSNGKVTNCYAYPDSSEVLRGFISRTDRDLFIKEYSQQTLFQRYLGSYTISQDSIDNAVEVLGGGSYEVECNNCATWLRNLLEELHITIPEWLHADLTSGTST